jgi:hypothetical protein
MHLNPQPCLSDRNGVRARTIARAFGWLPCSAHNGAGGVVRALKEAHGSVEYARNIAHGLANAASHEYTCKYDGLPGSRDKHVVSS